MLEESLLPQAVDMARRGCTQGMIIQMLRAHDLKDDAARRVIVRAFRIAARRNQAKGLVQLTCGIGLVAAGLIGIYWIHQTRQRGLEKIATSVCVFGLFIGGCGLITLFRGAPNA